MKTKLLVLLAVLGVVAYGAITLDDLAKSHIQTMQADGSITNVLNLLITEGTFCQVRGHTWGQHFHLTLEYSPGKAGCRECSICKLHQTQYVTDWK